MSINGNVSYGRALMDNVASIIPTFGRIFIVKSSSDSSDPNYAKLDEVFKADTEGVVRVFTTLADAYAAVTSNNNDVICLDAHTSHALTGMLTVAKNRVNFIGMDGGGRINSQGTKITLATAVAGDVATVLNTGVRNSFRNIKFIQSGTNTAQIYGFIDAGEGTYAENCHFDHYTLLSTAGTAGLLFAGDTCNYVHCQFGNSTVYRTGNPTQALLVGNYGSAFARYSYFENCEFVQYSSQTTARCVGTTGAAHVIGWIKFNACGFNGGNLGDGATAGGTQAAAVVSALTSGYLLIDNRCSFFNITAACSTNASNINASGVAVAAAAGGKGIAGA